MPVENEVPCSSVHEMFWVKGAVDDVDEIPVPEAASVAVPFEVGYGTEVNGDVVVNDEK